MTRLKILKYPDPLLQQKADAVTAFDSSLARLLDNMLETMYSGNGVGLAGPQVGELKRLLVLDISPRGDHPMEFINPVITYTEGSVTADEGCLSLPEYREMIKRAQKIRLTAQKRNGESFELEAEDLLARCIQHENDHLDGILCIDRISRIKKGLFRSWYKKRGPFE